MDKYYKLQYFCEVSLSWKDIQKSFESSNAAILSSEVKPNIKYRVMEVAGKKRTPLEVFSTHTNA